MRPIENFTYFPLPWGTDRQYGLSQPYFSMANRREQAFCWPKCTPSWERAGQSRNAHASAKVAACNAGHMELQVTEASDRSSRTAHVTMYRTQIEALRECCDFALGAKNDDRKVIRTAVSPDQLGNFAVLEAERLSDNSLVYNVRFVRKSQGLDNSLVVDEAVIPCYDDKTARQLWEQMGKSCAADLVDETDHPRVQ